MKKKTGDIDRNIVVVSGVAVIMFFLIVTVCCTYKMYKSQKKSNPVVKEEFNPDYGDYSNIYPPSEIYDRNPYYAYMEETSAMVIRDNNPD